MIKTLEYTPSGSVCSRQIYVEVDDEVIVCVRFIKGCSGNAQGVASLLEGMNIHEAIARLKGIDCRGKGTSCPDQLALALEEIISESSTQ